MNQYRHLGLLLLALWTSCSVLAQTIEETLRFNWQTSPQLKLAYGGYKANEQFTPQWSKRYPLSQASDLDVSIQTQKEQRHTWMHADKVSANEFEVAAQLVYEKGRPFAVVTVTPLRQISASEVALLQEARLTLQARPRRTTRGQARTTSFKTNSTLSTGDVFKMRLQENGVYRLDYNFLKNLGVDVDNINPQNIHIYYNGPGMLPERNDQKRFDDLNEIPIEVVGAQDGRFDASDYVLFYGAAPNQWHYNKNQNRYDYNEDLYSNWSYFFLKVDNQTGLRIGQAPNLTASTSTTSYDALLHHEQNTRNLLEEAFSLSPSGRDWFGEAFKFSRNQQVRFEFSNRLETEPIQISGSLAARAFNSSSQFVVNVNGLNAFSNTLNIVANTTYALFARQVRPFRNMVVSGQNLDVDLIFSNASTTAEGWLDYLSVEARCALQWNGESFLFSDKNTLNQSGPIQYEIANANNQVRIWEVTNPVVPRQMPTSIAGNTLQVVAQTDTLRTFIAFSTTKTPEPLGRVANQNLHSLQPTDMLVVYHERFESEVDRFIQHRSTHSGLSIQKVEVQQIYNEFGGGRADLTAVRDLIRMLYIRSNGNDSLRYVLLFGAGSFDYKSNQFQGESNTNYIPVYQSPESLDPITSYTSDDYFALLDEDEGNSTSIDLLDVALGRFPVRSLEEAKTVVDKIIYYETNPEVLDDWKNRLLFMADDEDGNQHINDADRISRDVAIKDSIYNIDKIYLDAFPQVSTTAGTRYPAVTEKILSTLFKGTFVVNYMGHGGDEGITQERCFTTSEISQLKNKQNLPLFITATCSFAPHDDPSVTSAGELLLLNSNGGAIALMTTVRVVYATQNETLTRMTFEELFERDANGAYRSLGEIIRLAKNRAIPSTGINTRKFALLGDPSMKLAYPSYNVATTSINGKPSTQTDTLSALETVTIEGEIQDKNGNRLTNFNGTIYPTVFDKPDQIKTRANDPGSNPYGFTLQTKVIFKGRASVTNGRFSFTFVVPKDINYLTGKGKISYYADNQAQDASGAFFDIVIGGTDTSAPADDTPPLVDVFMNDEKFALGGVTDANPVLLAKLSDDNGINVVGNGIGHDLTAILDENTQDTRVLNEFYESDKDDYRSGVVRYPLSELENGKHTLRVKAWDTHNNSGEGYTEFIVANNAELALENVLNYPNPFTTHTRFQFEHNHPGQPLDVQVRIFTVSGKLIKTINEQITPEGYRVDNIAWDGLDEFGDRIGRGVYIYKIIVRTQGLSGETETKESSEFQKLVILR